MESPDDVRASVTVLALADLRDHEETSPAREREVERLLAESDGFSWPLVADCETGLILDGSHRARVLTRGGARVVPVQHVSLRHPSVRVGVWWRLLAGVPPAAFEPARRRLALVAGEDTGRVCRYHGQTYGRGDIDPVAAHGLARDLAAALGGNGHGLRARLVADDEVPADFDGADTLLVCPPPLDRAAIEAHARNGRLPAKTTRFVLPYRVLGLAMPFEALSGPRSAVATRARASLEAPLVCLGAGLEVDRRYPERLWQPAGYQVPPTLFVDPTAHARYRAARTRAAADADRAPGSRPGSTRSPEPSRERCQES
jgi:hypothetical protein